MCNKNFQKSHFIIFLCKVTFAELTKCIAFNYCFELLSTLDFYIAIIIVLDFSDSISFKREPESIHRSSGLQCDNYLIDGYYVCPSLMCTRK